MQTLECKLSVLLAIILLTYAWSIYTAAKADLEFFITHWLFEVYTAIAIFVMLILHVLHLTVCGCSNMLGGMLIIFSIIMIVLFINLFKALFLQYTGLYFIKPNPFVLFVAGLKATWPFSEYAVAAIVAFFLQEFYSLELIAPTLMCLYSTYYSLSHTGPYDNTSFRFSSLCMRLMQQIFLIVVLTAIDPSNAVMWVCICSTVFITMLTYLLATATVYLIKWSRKLMQPYSLECFDVRWRIVTFWVILIWVVTSFSSIFAVLPTLAIILVLSTIETYATLMKQQVIAKVRKVVKRFNNVRRHKIAKLKNTVNNAIVLAYKLKKNQLRRKGAITNFMNLKSVFYYKLAMQLVRLLERPTLLIKNTTNALLCCLLKLTRLVFGSNSEGFTKTASAVCLIVVLLLIILVIALCI